MRAIIQPEDDFQINAAVGNGAAKRVERFNLVGGVVQCTVSGGSYRLEGTIDGVNWVTVQDTITANAIVELTHFWRMLRMVTVEVGDMEASLGAHEYLGHG